MASFSRGAGIGGIRTFPYAYATLRIRIRRAGADNSRMSNTSRWARLTVLASMSPAGAVLGGAVDEHLRLGFTVWRSACRASGISISSVIAFTLELLPNAVIGALLGALLVQVLAFSMRRRQGSVETGLAAHTGCVIAMPAGLTLCALALPVAWMLLAEIALAVLAAFCVMALAGRHAKTSATVHP